MAISLRVTLGWLACAAAYLPLVAVAQGPSQQGDERQHVDSFYRSARLQTDQPPAAGDGETDAIPPRQPPRQADTRVAAAPRRSSRLASVPNMFGDFFAHGGTLLADSATGQAVVDLPTAGGSRRVKIAENNSALPGDRVYFLYNHFHNALRAEAIALSRPPEQRRFQVDRFSFGLERSFLDGAWSAELRMPLTGTYRFDVPDSFFVEGGNLGNLALILKNAVYETPDLAVAAGVGFDFPTGSDVDGEAGGFPFQLSNESLHILPFVGLSCTPGESLFLHGFLQIDIAANGDTFSLQNESVKITEQNLLYVDAAAGYWLYRDEGAALLTGVAGIAELHFSTSLQDADTNQIVANGTFLTLTHRAVRTDVANLTVGVHAELADATTLMAGGVFPLGERSDRFFDAELLVAVNFYR